MSSESILKSSPYRGGGGGGDAHDDVL